jgi:hypothetical protein
VVGNGVQALDPGLLGCVVRVGEVFQAFSR